MALPSFMSVHVDSVRSVHGASEETRSIITGSGFVLRHGGQPFLVTNGHIVTGQHRVTGDPLGSAALPEFLDVALPMSGSGLGADEVALLGISHRRLALYDDRGRARWLVHPTFGRRVDVVALPIAEDNQGGVTGFTTTLLPYELGTSDPVAMLQPTQDLSVVGFPFGLHGGARSAIWVRGTIASEPDLPFEGESCFLVDSRTRAGQSGSPVILFRPSEEGTASAGAVAESWCLVGVYSGRTSGESDLGRVWTWSSLRAVVEGGERDVQVYD
ncbi:trypsin-like peptidase domain-containing protein [Curtobacterium citreum]|uniref:trypsin-like peptidase domain-containing protein n=1 Tax=Curtobacterium citreum TaxID=2036 RepID=UPI0034D598D3